LKHVRINISFLDRGLMAEPQANQRDRGAGFQPAAEIQATKEGGLEAYLTPWQNGLVR
jgi:hypothetical protein